MGNYTASLLGIIQNILKVSMYGLAVKEKHVDSLFPYIRFLSLVQTQWLYCFDAKARLPLKMAQETVNETINYKAALATVHR
ncbi:hypothetical protein AC249_AIPGENE12644 [Exaiptasia diaphana]|nr:hypothetical protein AC249_AIPGENE12644 [Exaiptasia diaphana]